MMKKTYGWFCLLSLLLVSSVNGMPMDATLLNGDFEGSFTNGIPQNWKLMYGSSATDVAESNDGVGDSKCVELNCSAESDVWIGQNVTGVNVGGDITFQVWYNTSDLLGWFFVVMIEFRNASYEWIDYTIDTASASTSGFQTLSVTWNGVPSNTVFTTVYFGYSALRKAAAPRATFPSFVCVDDATISGTAVHEFETLPLILTTSLFIVALVIFRKK